MPQPAETSHIVQQLVYLVELLDLSRLLFWRYTYLSMSHPGFDIDQLLIFTHEFLTVVTSVVQAVNSVGHSEFSKVYSFQTAASVPAAPEAPTLVTATATSMIVEWQVHSMCLDPA